MQLKPAISQLDGLAEEEAQIADETNRVEKRKGVLGSGASFFHKELGIFRSSYFETTSCLHIFGSSSRSHIVLSDHLQDFIMQFSLPLDKIIYVFKTSSPRPRANHRLVVGCRWWLVSVGGCCSCLL